MPGSILTVGEIKTEIRGNLGGRTDLDSRLNKIIDMIQLRLARIKDFDELQVTDAASTTTGNADDVDKYVTIPTNSGRMRHLYSVRLQTGDANSRKLSKVLPREWDKHIPDTDYLSRGKPRIYTVWGNVKIELHQIPDAVYTLLFRLSVWPAAVTSDNDNLTLENMDDAFIALATSHCFMSLGEKDRSDQWFRIFATVARDIMTEEEIRETDMLIRGAPGRLEDATLPGEYYNDPFVDGIDGV